MNEIQPLLTPRQVAEIFRVSVGTAFNLALLLHRIRPTVQKNRTTREIRGSGSRETLLTVEMGHAIRPRRLSSTRRTEEGPGDDRAEY